MSKINLTPASADGGTILGVPVDAMREKLKDAADVQGANSMPFPGAAAAAFSPCPDIQVRQFKVRPLYDADFEILQAAGHPLCDLTNVDNAHFGEKLGDHRGPNAWLVCWLFTQSAESADAFIAEKGLEAVKAQARKDWGRQQLGLIIEINMAVMKQYSAYFSTIVGFEESAEDGAPKKERPS